MSRALALRFWGGPRASLQPTAAIAPPHAAGSARHRLCSLGCFCGERDGRNHSRLPRMKTSGCGQTRAVLSSSSQTTSPTLAGPTDSQGREEERTGRQARAKYLSYAKSWEIKGASCPHLSQAAPGVRITERGEGIRSEGKIRGEINESICARLPRRESGNETQPRCFRAPDSKSALISVPITGTPLQRRRQAIMTEGAMG
ncbi:hypothetical protein AAFF_G00284330 [Aldrovandia affinis]|uniref:Uncharacterized protein n=1 Tax=Aldrovandia affinis TaxID=143900 RepID=A0AAD7X140_9TELE|nr:hypothetical protein AAFF_G00284330 [Aldrovandia affinis]